MKFLELTGEKFGRLTALKRGPDNKHGRVTWVCKCDCGSMVPSLSSNELMTGNTRSCGCLNRELIVARNLSHGKTHTHLYRTFHNIKTRCNNSNIPNFFLYGGRGIKCEWKSFEEFEEDMGKEFHEKWKGKGSISIERIDVNGNYCKDNCKWATPIEQANNTRRNHFLTYNGQTKTLTEWARLVNSKQARIRHRLKLGFTVEQALTFKKNQYRI